VVSANKQLLALDPDLLRPAVDADVRDLVCSASVGGGVPALETVAAVLGREPIVAIEGVLNGTCNFVLDRCAEGTDLNDAVAEAQAIGLAEADPHLDVSGLDCVYKLALLASQAFDRPVAPGDIQCEGLDRLTTSRIAAAREQGRVLKLVAEARRSGGTVIARVEVRDLAPGDPLATCRGEGNILLVETSGGRRVRVEGKGAGRWPTAVSVVGDALQVRRDLLAGYRRFESRKEASS
jgi:homoserine dehydrogenase